MKKLIIILAIILLALLAERFAFRTVHVDIEMNPPVLRANLTSEMTLTLTPKNSLGFRTPFAKSRARFDIEEGANLIELVQNMEYDHAVIRSKGIEGEAVVGIYSLKSGILLNKILIKIVPGNIV